MEIGEAQVYVTNMGIGTGHLKLSGQAPFFREFKNLSEYNLISASLTKSTTDALWSLRVNFPATIPRTSFRALIFQRPITPGIYKCCLEDSARTNSPPYLNLKV